MYWVYEVRIDLGPPRKDNMIEITNHYTTQVFLVKRLDDEYVASFFVPDFDYLERTPETEQMAFRLEWLNKASKEFEDVTDENMIKEVSSLIIKDHVKKLQIPKRPSIFKKLFGGK